MTLRKISVALVAAAAVAALAPAAALAGPYAGYVTAYSRYGNGAVRGPVRHGQFGPQVRLPGGTWLYCERTSLLFDRHRPCSETLRRATLDFWETMAEEGSSGR